MQVMTCAVSAAAMDVDNGDGNIIKVFDCINEDIKHCSTLGSALHDEVESVGVHWSWVILP